MTDTCIEVQRPDATVFVLFGGGGDLARRKIAPALFNLYLEDRLPEHFVFLGIARQDYTEDAYRKQIREAVEKFSRRETIPEDKWNAFAKQIRFLRGDLNDSTAYRNLADRLTEIDTAWSEHAAHVFYLSTPPALFEGIARHLDEAGLAKDQNHARIVVEKPFGHDLDSARALNRTLAGIFSERQIYRIDHYLGKETVRNLLAFRFANALFEPVWNRRYIDHVQIMAAEQGGIEQRGPYYDHAGALRDMVQNHLLRLLTLTAMEPPVSFDADELRNKQIDVLSAVRPIPDDRVDEFAVRGQYAAGNVDGKTVAGYRDEEKVARDSNTETFAAVKLFVDNWRWQGVPFYLRSGKRLPVRASEIVIEFRPVPHRSFPATAVRPWEPNRLTIRIQPEEGILLRFQAKQPGPPMCLRPVDMRFSYCEAFKTTGSEAYETLLLDVMLGDQTLFLRTDQSEAAWGVVMPVLHYWEQKKASDFPNYPAGTWGPKAAAALLERDGRHWLFSEMNESESCS